MHAERPSPGQTFNLCNTLAFDQIPTAVFQFSVVFNEVYQSHKGGFSGGNKLEINVALNINERT